MNFLSKTVSVFSTVLRDPSNKGQRAFRLLAAFAWQIYKRTVPFPIILPLDNGVYFVADPAAGNSVGAIYTRVYESQYVLFSRKHISGGGVLCDVGAHTGLYTLLLASSF